MASEEALSFREDLWDNFDAIVKKLTEGKKIIKKLQLVLKEQCSMYEKLGKSFSKTKLITEKDDLGFLTEPMITIGEYLSNIGSKHVYIAQEIYGKDLYKDLEELRKRLSKEIKESVKEEKKLRSEFNSAKSLVESAKQKDISDKQKYEKAAADRVQAVDEAQNDDSSNDPNLDPKIIEKRKKVQAKKLSILSKGEETAKKSQELAEKAYKKAVENFENVHERYYDCLKARLSKLETLDLTRLKKMKAILSRYAELQEELSKEFQQGSTLLINCFAAIDPEKDIQEFISKNKSGNIPDPPLPFEPYQVTLPDENSIKKKSSSGEVFQTGIATSVFSPSENEPQEEVEYQVLKIVSAIYDYKKQSDEEIDLNSGDEIEIYQMNEDGWWLGKNKATSQRGLFPSNFIQDLSENAVNPVLLAGDENLEPGNFEDDGNAMPADRIDTVEALYDYEAQDETEISLQQGMVVDVYQKNEDGWWYGGIDNTRGFFPSNYVQQVQ